MTEGQYASPTVSVVMPTYNRAHLLPPVVESILSQDFRDLELVIVDDGSTDNTAEIVQEIQAQDPRVRYVRLPQNRGVGFARDAGLRYAQGQYIALADSDDLWLPGRLGEQVAILEKYPEIDILFGDWWDINHVKGTRRRAFEGSPGLQEVEARPLGNGLFLVERGLETGILKSNFIATPTMVLRRGVLDRVGGFLPYLKTPELEFYWRAAVLGARFAYLERPLIERHVHRDSRTAQGDRLHLERLEAVEAMYGTCRRLGRRDLAPHVRATEVRTYCNLLRIYGERGDRGRVLRTYLWSLRRGFSLRATKWFLVALLGPRALAWAVRKGKG
jgi:glycosyltransferase involved in cell wall biosynthesis